MDDPLLWSLNDVVEGDEKQAPELPQQSWKQWDALWQLMYSNWLTKLWYYHTVSSFRRITSSAQISILTVSQCVQWLVLPWSLLSDNSCIYSLSITLFSHRTYLVSFLVPVRLPKYHSQIFFQLYLIPWKELPEWRLRFSFWNFHCK